MMSCFIVLFIVRITVTLLVSNRYYFGNITFYLMRIPINLQVLALQWESMTTLSVGSGYGSSQSNTQSPQTLVNPTVNPTPNATTGGNVQPGTTTSLLNASANGVKLQSMPLTTINLNSSTQQTQSLPAPPRRPVRHVNGALLGVCIALIIVAIAIFWWMTKSSKNTTNY